jgi:hypothetical protein
MSAARPLLPLLLAALLLGCGASGPPPPDPEEIMRAEFRKYNDLFAERVKVQEELIEVLSGVQTAKDMQDAKDRFQKRNDYYEDLARRFRELPQPSPALARRLDRSLQERFLQTHSKLAEETERIRRLPGGVVFLAELKALR